MRLTIVFTVLGQHDLATYAIRQALQNCTDPNTQIVVIDNGGDFSYADPRVMVKNLGKNIGVYPVFDYAFKNTAREVLAFFHSDLIITEKGFDKAILHNFESKPLLGLIGFVGSNEIDAAGGRGAGTTSNFQGQRHYFESGEGERTWMGSPAEAHGKRDGGFTDAAVVDGCAMVIRRLAWEQIGFRSNFPPHHFYDRLICTQMLEARWRIGVLGIGCDHISGQTVGGQAYLDFAREWCEENLPKGKWVGNPPDYSWDQSIYQEAERQWLGEYRDQKHLVPIKV